MKNQDHLKNISIAALSAIPITGGPISVLFDKYIPEHIGQKRNKLLQQINEELSFIEQNNTDFDIQNERFISIFTKCMKKAMEEFEKEKIEAFKNIILNYSIHQDMAFDETTLFINWIQEFTVDQIKLIRSIDRHDSIAYQDVKSGDLYQLLKVLHPDAPLDYLMIIGQDLISKKIVMHHNSIFSRELRKQQKIVGTNQIWHLSYLGKRFVEFITTPYQK